MRPFENTYCNPISLPDYPRGACTYGDKQTQTGFLQNPPMDFRETADPSVLYWNNKWYLYPSCGMAWVSEDFQTWTHHRIEPYTIGYAPQAMLPVDRRFYAVDGTMTTWWQPADTDTTPAMEIRFNGRFDISAFRLIWKDVGLDYNGGILPGPFHYRLCFADATTAPWTPEFESAPSKDLLIDYRTFPTRRATRVRLEVLGSPPGIRPGLVDFSVFGTGITE